MSAGCILFSNPKKNLKTRHEILNGFKNFLLAGHGLSEITARNHVRTVKSFIKNTDRAIPSPDSAMGYLGGLRGRGLSYSHVRNTTRGLWWYFQFWGIKLKVKYPKKPKTEVQETLADKEISKLIKRCEAAKDKALILLLSCAGIRTRELRNLKVKDVNLKKLVLSVVQGKNLADRTICLTPECAEAIKTFLREQNKYPEDYLFGEDQNKPMSIERLRALFRRLEKSAKINKRLHVYLFRHSLATNLLMNGADILTVQRQLGHKDPRTTLSYINYTDKLFHRQYQKYMPRYCNKRNFG